MCSLCRGRMLKLGWRQLPSLRQKFEFQGSCLRIRQLRSTRAMVSKCPASSPATEAWVDYVTEAAPSSCSMPNVVPELGSSTRLPLRFGAFVGLYLFNNFFHGLTRAFSTLSRSPRHRGPHRVPDPYPRFRRII